LLACREYNNIKDKKRSGRSERKTRRKTMDRNLVNAKPRHNERYYTDNFY